MLSRADVSLLSVIQTLAKYGKDAGYLVPTETGMSKSILDAHASLRSYLAEKGIHDYGSQRQGVEDKRTIDVFLVGVRTLTPTKMSLYRPETKTGDPRVWIYGLPKYARPLNLLVLLECDGVLYVVNASDPEIFESRDIAGSPLSKLLSAAVDDLDEVAAELIEKMSSISRMGYVDSLRIGDTGVGMTLETLLGITANSNKAPDYRGIEIKATRVSGVRRTAKTRVNLFSQVPDWTISVINPAMKY